MQPIICRCCLTENPRFTYDIYDGRNNLLDQLKECLSPQIGYSVEDGLPRVICDLCRLRLQEVSEFRHNCLYSYNQLKQRTAELKEKAVKEVLTLIDKLREGDNQKIQKLEKYESVQLLPLAEQISIPTYDDNSRAHHPTHPVVQVEASSNLSNKNNDAVDSSNSSITNSSKKNSYPCSECDKKFTRNFQLKLHLISVHKLGEGLQQYKCKSCQQQFASLHSLNYHNKARHTLERPFACQRCQRKFILRSQLNSHARIHSGERKPRVFECSQCSKRWPTKSDLRTHMRSHNPDSKRPFGCEVCGKRFLTRGHLISHRLVHTGEKPFVCEFCPRNYQSIGNLNNHMLRHHLDEVESKLQKLDQGRILFEL